MASSGGSTRPRFALAPPLPLDDQAALELARSWLQAIGPDATDDTPPGVVRPLIWSSWQRSLQAGVDPALLPAPGVTGGVGPPAPDGTWAAVVARLDSDLAEDAAADTMTVVLTDATGTVLWTGGSWGMGHRTEALGVRPGACWAESASGTNALGLALATGACAQVLRAEHHLRSLRSLAGAAAPVRDALGRVRGAVGVLGGDHVATPAVLALVRFVAAALTPVLAGAVPDGTTARPRLRVLGLERAVLEGPDGITDLSPKHSDLLLDLALAADRGVGRTAEELATDCWEAETSATTVRAEMHRLRRALPGLAWTSNPYRLPEGLAVDALDVLALLRRGDHQQALELHRGPVLPRSSSPATAQLRRRVVGQLRQALVTHADPDLLLAYADRAADDDVVVWQTLVDRLPPGSARPTAVARRDEVEDRLLEC